LHRFSFTVETDITAYFPGVTRSISELSFTNNQSGHKLLCRNTFIPVMEAAELWNGDNLSNIQHLSRKRTLLA